MWRRRPSTASRSPLRAGRTAATWAVRTNPARTRAVSTVPALAGVVALLGLSLSACSSHGASRRADSPATPTSNSMRTPAQGSSRPAGGGTAGSGTATTLEPSSPAAAWTTYQAGPDRRGVAPAGQPPLTPLRPAWTASLDGAAVYGQPLVAGGRVLVATEGDDLYALDPHDGSVVWRVTIGTPLRDVAAQVGCGNVDPLGVTSTPVADPAAGVVYAVGEVSTAGRAPVQHVMVAVAIGTGRVLERVDVDPPLPAGESPLYLLQRAALAVGNGRVYVGYGGHYGDCGTYHGWLVSVPTLGGAAAKTAFNVTPQSTGGAIWGGGAGPAIGGDGSVYVTTGNPNSGGPSPWAEAVVQLPPALGPVPGAAFQDRAASGDLDLATGGPVLLPGGEVFVVGKTDIGYRLRQDGLSARPAVHGAVCGSDPDGGTAYDAALGALFVPCRDGGIQEVDLAGNRTGWRSGAANSTPILAGGGLWALSYPAGKIQELDPATGRVLESLAVGRRVPTFASPSAADGLLLVPTAAGVSAFCGPGGPPSSAQR